MNTRKDRSASFATLEKIVNDSTLNLEKILDLNIYLFKDDSDKLVSSANRIIDLYNTLSNATFKLIDYYIRNGACREAGELRQKLRCTKKEVRTYVALSNGYLETLGIGNVSFDLNSTIASHTESISTIKDNEFVSPKSSTPTGELGNTNYFDTSPHDSHREEDGVTITASNASAVFGTEQTIASSSALSPHRAASSQIPAATTGSEIGSSALRFNRGLLPPSIVSEGSMTVSEFGSSAL